MQSLIDINLVICSKATNFDGYAWIAGPNHGGLSIAATSLGLVRKSDYVSGV